MTTPTEKIDLSTISDEELQAQDLVKRGEIDHAIAIYQQLEPQSARVLHTIGVLYAQKKGDYDLAISCYEQALLIQEEKNEITTGILTDLGFTYQNRGEFDLALTYHLRALSLRQSIPNIDPRLVASNLFGIANAYWGQGNLSEALTYAQQSLVLNESVTSGNNSNIASNLAILANIYHHSGDDIRALELDKRALLLLEDCMSPDAFGITSVLNNIGAIQVSAGLFNDALLTFIRVLHICERNLPEDHPKRIAINQNVQRIIKMQHEDIIHSFSHFRTYFSKLLLV